MCYKLLTTEAHVPPVYFCAAISKNVLACEAKKRTNGVKIKRIFPFAINFTSLLSGLQGQFFSAIVIQTKVVLSKTKALFKKHFKLLSLNNQFGGSI